MSWIGPTAAALAAVATATVIWLRWQLLVVTVQGLSMTPTHRDGDRLLVRRRQPGSLRPGQAVVVDLVPHSNDVSGRVRRIIKRVAAVPGDPVPDGVDWVGALVPPGKLVLLGDNSARSTDSRQFGFVDARRVVGVVVWSID
jgi:signal peptidase I